MHDRSSHHHGRVAELPRDTEGLPEASKAELVELQVGDEVEFEVHTVRHRHRIESIVPYKPAQPQVNVEALREEETLPKEGAQVS